MRRALKNGCLEAARKLGVFRLAAGSRWRQQRLLILCYHGFSLHDEHLWRPGLYVTAGQFRRRLEKLARGGFRVLPLGDAVQRLREGNLPARSVVLTVDDGFHDFHELAFPLLGEFGYPATVYQTTYYCDRPFPIFSLALRYVLWRGRGRRLEGAEHGVAESFDLSRAEEQERAVAAFLEAAGRQDYTDGERDALAARIAGALGVDYEEIRRRRMLHLMTSSEVAEVAAGGMDLQLHTHRHRVPRDERLFTREIRDNRAWLESAIGTRPAHFCYPSGEHYRELLPWLRAEQIVSATTCEHGLAAAGCEPLLLPRFLDSSTVSENEFESWLCGLAPLLRRVAPAAASATMLPTHAR